MKLRDRTGDHNVVLSKCVEWGSGWREGVASLTDMFFLSLPRLVRLTPHWFWISSDVTGCWRESGSVARDSPTGSCSRSSDRDTSCSLPMLYLRASWMGRKPALKW